VLFCRHKPETGPVVHSVGQTKRAADMAKEQLWWGYDFSCCQSVETILAAFKAASPWQWQLGDSDIYGFYVRCRPNENAEVRVYERRQFWTWRPGDGDGFYAELASDPANRSEIDQAFCRLLQVINAKNIAET
jgi:hypothetical protein